MESIFHNPSINKSLNLKEVVAEIVKYAEEKNAKYKIVVGTDSVAENYTQFVTAITILKIGNGGRYFWTKSDTEFCPTLQDRIYKETMKSITMVQELKNGLKEYAEENFLLNREVVIHIDVGENGPTKNLIETVVGMVKGYGFQAVIKPESFCAFAVADRHCKTPL